MVNVNGQKLIFGDCLEVMDRLIAKGVKVDAIITDPPYGTTACPWDTVIPFDAMWERLGKLIKPHGAVVLFGSEPFSSYLRLSNIKNYKYDLVWDKIQGKQPFLAKIQPMKSHENVVVFGDGKLNYNPQMGKGIPYKKGERTTNSEHWGTGTTNPPIDNKGERYPVTVLTFNVPNPERGLHPTQKPVALIEYLICTYTNEGEVVLDFTAGSFTTLVACVQVGRRGIGIENDHNYFETGVDRVTKAKCKKDVGFGLTY